MVPSAGKMASGADVLGDCTAISHIDVGATGKGAVKRRALEHQGRGLHSFFLLESADGGRSLIRASYRCGRRLELGMGGDADRMEDVFVESRELSLKGEGSAVSKAVSVFCQPDVLDVKMSRCAITD